MSSRGNNVGILAMEVYFPSNFVKQSALELANGVSKGKYTVGLGQTTMAFTGDREDINSISLTVVHSLLEKYDISPHEIGRLEIGTETLIDKSKSTKTVLMQLFEGNTDIEGATVLNACYGGTAALLNALNWVDSGSWDGRFAIVVAADIAVYSDGPARPTGGCGAVAMLIGRNAPLAINLTTRATHATHVWDFFKPNMESEYPTVNGALSQTCYLRALDDVYSRFCAKDSRISDRPRAISNTDYFLFHSPYNKLVQKSFGRLVYLDMKAGRMDNPANSIEGASVGIEKWSSLPAEMTYENKELETHLKNISVPLYQEKVSCGCEISQLIGNTYTASVYLNLANLVSTKSDSLDGRSLVLFSYGSGALASMFEIKPASNTESRFSLSRMATNLNLASRLADRECLPPEALSEALSAREQSHGKIPFRPTFSTDNMYPGTYYLEEINSSFERVYARKAHSAARVVGGPLISSALVTSNPRTSAHGLEDVSPEMMKLATQLQATKTMSSSSSVPRGGMGMKRSDTFVWAGGRPNTRVVITGVSVALPGRDKSVFNSSGNNIQRIIDGENFISQIPLEVRLQMLEKNIVMLTKNKTDGSLSRSPIVSIDDNISLSASIGHFDLTSYGLSESIVGTMDRAVQVAVAVGLEALKDAGIVTGEGPGTSGWVLPASMQETTGVVYATSFPALDTAIEEVSRFFTCKLQEAKRQLTRPIEEVINVPHIISELRKRLVLNSSTLEPEDPSKDVLSAMESLEHLLNETLASSLPSAEEKRDESPIIPYEFDRKFLFRVLVLGNAQLAQIIKARGPNLQTNAACAGSTQAMSLAYDMIQLGRAERMVLIAGDNASSDTLMPWLGNGFRALGAATICPIVEQAACPFDPRRSGMILGAGGMGMVLESEEGAQRRFAQQLSRSPTPNPSMKARPYLCRLIGTLVSNSAYHGASMDRKHIAHEMERFISAMEIQEGISRKDIAKYGVYFSHETGTHASPDSSCAANEIYALRQVFATDLKHLLIANTKAYTGHSMGVSFEDAVAAEVLVTGQVPPIPNTQFPDPHLGGELNLSRGGHHPHLKYSLRFAAGFGSQIALALYGKYEPQSTVSTL